VRRRGEIPGFSEEYGFFVVESSAAGAVA